MPIKTWDCPKCGTKGIDGMFCPECGAKNTAPKLYCATCEKEIDSKFCTKCGNKATQITDRGKYIELIPAIGGLHLIAKEIFFDYLETAEKLSKKFEIDGFSNWRIPSVEELLLIYKIKDLCGISDTQEFWSSYTAGRETTINDHWEPFWNLSVTNHYEKTVDFSNGREMKKVCHCHSFEKIKEEHQMDGVPTMRDESSSDGEKAYFRFVW